MTSQSAIVTCLQLETPTDATKKQRVDQAMQSIDRAPRSDLIVLPELWPTGYFAFDRYQAEAESISGIVTSRLRTAALKRRCYIVGGSFVERHEGGLANCAVMIDPDGEIALTYRKIHLFGNGSEEAALLTPGTDLAVADAWLGPIAVTTCYDLRFPELYRALVDSGARLVVVVAAWPAVRREHWRLLAQARAIENQLFVVACNGAGVQRGTPLAGASLVVDPRGEILAIAGALEQTLTATIDLSQVDQVRREFPVLADRRSAFTARANHRTQVPFATARKEASHA
jgi:predicted amidohydrolase